MVPNNAAGAGALRSAFGLVLFERDPFLSNGNLPDAQISGGSAETGEEDWLDQNSTPLLINRFNGTLLRSE
jgi:hypothetical protein